MYTRFLFSSVIFPRTRRVGPILGILRWEAYQASRTINGANLPGGLVFCEPIT